MNPIALAAQALIAALDVYRFIATKPANWTPTPAEWQHLRDWAKRTPDQIKAEAAAELAPHHD